MGNKTIISSELTFKKAIKFWEDTYNFFVSEKLYHQLDCELSYNRKYYRYDIIMRFEQ